MQIEIHGSLVTIQYYNKCTDPFYPKFTSKKISALIFCWNLYQVIAYVLIPTTEKVNTHLSVISPNNGTISSTKIHGYGIPRQIWPQICNKTLTTASKLGAIFLEGEPAVILEPAIMEYKR